METKQFESLIQAVTGRKLTIAISTDEIPLESKITIQRGNRTKTAFEWKTPKKEDSILRSFITAFCSKYREPDPTTYESGSWEKNYADKWNNPETHETCAAWYHHASHMFSPQKLRAQIESNFSEFTADMARLGFYSTLYGIGMCTVYGGQWVRDALQAMSDHLKTHGIHYRNEMSEAGWVTRFVIGMEKSQHTALLGKF